MTEHDCKQEVSVSPVDLPFRMPVEKVVKYKQGLAVGGIVSQGMIKTGDELLLKLQGGVNQLVVTAIGITIFGGLVGSAKVGEDPMVLLAITGGIRHLDVKVGSVLCAPP